MLLFIPLTGWLADQRIEGSGLKRRDEERGGRMMTLHDIRGGAARPQKTHKVGTEKRSDDNPISFLASSVSSDIAITTVI